MLKIFKPTNLTKEFEEKAFFRTFTLDLVEVFLCAGENPDNLQFYQFFILSKEKDFLNNFLMIPHESGDNEQQELILRYEEMAANGSISFLAPQSFENLLNYYEADCRWEEALSVAENALSQHPYSSVFHLRKALFLLETDELEEAMESLEKAEALTPSEPEILLLKADILSAYGDYDKALFLLLERYKNASAELKADLSIAISSIYEYKGDFQNAYTYLEKVLLVKGQAKNALERICHLAEQTDNIQSCIKLHDILLDKDPYSVQCWFNMGLLQFAELEYQKAAEAFDFACIIQPLHDLAWKKGAEVLFSSAAYEEAIYWCEKAIAYIGNDNDLLFCIGECHEQMEEYDKAKHFYLKLLKQKPHDAMTHYRMGECYACEDNWLAASSSFRMALRSEPEHPAYLAALGEANGHLGDVDEAIRLFTAAVELASNNAELWIQYLTFLVEIEAYSLAEKVADVALWHCDDAEISYAMAAILFLNGSRQQALQTLAEALTEDYDVHEVIFDIAPELEEDVELILEIHRYRDF